MDITPEQQQLSEKLINRYPIMRAPTVAFFVRAMNDALEFHGCYLNFWRTHDMRYFIIYRVDRKPFPSEFLPFLQTLFVDTTENLIHEVSNIQKNPFGYEFVQGNIYETRTLADKMGDDLTEHADKTDEVEQFDFDETSTAKRMMKSKDE
jgi:hypothetical protein